VEVGKRCRYFGPWTSFDSSRTIKFAWVDDVNRDDCRYRTRDRIRALYVGNQRTVYVSGDYAFWFIAVIALASVAYLCGTVFFVRRRRRD
jgi:hypothetical protein